MPTAKVSKLARVRPPRVHLGFEAGESGALHEQTIPFTVGVAADLRGHTALAEPIGLRRFTEVTIDTFDDYLNSQQPSLDLKLPDHVTLTTGGMLSIHLKFERLDDFGPDPTVQRVPALRELAELRRDLRLLASVSAMDPRVNEVLRSLLENPGLDAGSGIQAIGQWILGRGEGLREALGNVLGESNRGRFRAGDVVSIFTKEVARIDAALSDQVAAILHAPEYQRLESVWRGLHYLVRNSELSSELRVVAISMNRLELLRDLEMSADPGDTRLLAHLEDELYELGGRPFNVFLVDCDLTGRVEDVELARHLAEIGRKAHCAILASAAPELMRLASFADLGYLRLGPMPETPEWRDFRTSESAAYLYLALPRVLMRAPYGRASGGASELFQFEECGGDPGSADYLWGSPIYTLAQRITDACSRFNWPARINGMEGGGMVEGIPLIPFGVLGTDLTRCSTEFAISVQRGNWLAAQGFIALCHLKDVDSAMFPAVPSCRQPGGYDSPEANGADAGVSTLAAILCACRVSHYVIAQAQSARNRGAGPADYEKILNQWLATYVLFDDTAAPTVAANRPMRDARLEILQSDLEGAAEAVLLVRPHFQIALDAPVRIVMKLPPRA